MLFWLDAHYSGKETAQGPEDSPIIHELNYILNNCKDSYILIDDARCFNGKSGYPKISFLKKWLADENSKNTTPWLLEVKNDIIRIAKSL